MFSQPFLCCFFTIIFQKDSKKKKKNWKHCIIVKRFFFSMKSHRFEGTIDFFTFSSFTVVNHLVLCYPCYDHLAFSTYLPNESSVFHITCGSSVKSFTVRQSKHVLKSRYVLYYRQFVVGESHVRPTGSVVLTETISAPYQLPFIVTSVCVQIGWRHRFEKIYRPCCFSRTKMSQRAFLLRFLTTCLSFNVF